MKLALALVAGTLLSTAAQATSVLYRVDGVAGTDYMAQALGSLGYDVTTISSDLSSYSLGSYDAVVYANQNFGISSGDIASLDAYVGSGGKVIYTGWTEEYPSLGGSHSGNLNLVTLTVGPLFAAGLSNPISVISPGWGIFSRGLTAGDGTVAGQFENGDAAILVGNGGRTVWNGFLTDTVENSQLYVNELTFLVGGTVPEPASWALMIGGFSLVGVAARRRRNIVAA